MDVDKEDYAPMQDGDIINNLKILQLDEDEIQPIESDEDDSFDLPDNDMESSFCDRCFVDTEMFWDCEMCDNYVLCERCYFDSKHQHSDFEADGDPYDSIPFLSSLCAVTIAENADRIKGWEKLSDEVKPLILRQFSKTVRYPYSTDTLRLLFGSHQRCLDTKKFVHIDPIEYIPTAFDMCINLHILDLSNAENLPSHVLAKIPKKIHKLRQLIADFTQMNNEILSEIAEKNKYLEILSVYGCPNVTFDIMKKFLCKPKFMEFEKDGVRVSRKEFYGVISHAWNVYLGKYDNVEEDDEELEVEKIFLDSITLKSLSGCIPSISRLICDRCEVDNQGICYLIKYHPELSWFVGHQDIGEDAMVELFANCKNIEQIQIVAASFNNKVISSVLITSNEEFTEMNRINIEEGPCEITDDLMSVFIRRCPKLNELIIEHGQNIGKVTFGSLGSCSQLKRLEISSCYNMSKDSISKLKTCRNLTTLKLRSNPITDTYTTGLRELISLTELDLSYTYITDVTLSFLTDLPIASLQVVNTAVSYEGVRQLLAKSSTISVLHIDKTKITEQEANKLRDMNPTKYIVYIKQGSDFGPKRRKKVKEEPEIIEFSFKKREKELDNREHAIRKREESLQTESSKLRDVKSELEIKEKELLKKIKDLSGQFKTFMTAGMKDLTSSTTANIPTVANGVTELTMGSIVNDGVQKVKEPNGEIKKKKKVCFVCGKSARLKCGSCLNVRYCGPACQLKHWDEGHYKNCTTPVIEM